jgi:hypothetical protein
MYVLHDRREISQRVVPKKAGAPVVPELCQNPSIGAVGVSFEREADSPICWKR